MIYWLYQKRASQESHAVGNSEHFGRKEVLRQRRAQELCPHRLDLTMRRRNDSYRCDCGSLAL